MSARDMTFGGKTWTVGPLNWGQLSEIYPEFLAIPQLTGGEVLEARKRTIIAALSGQATVEELGKLPTDLIEILEASEVVADVSGYSRLGEWLAAKMETPSKAGKTSSPSPAPAPDGASETSDS
jgi:hypothetical protein